MDISVLESADKIKLIESRWKTSDILWSQLKKTYDKNKSLWQNRDEKNNNFFDRAINLISKKRKEKDNRIFLAMESVLNNLTGRPSKPSVIPAVKDNLESRKISNNLQSVFIEKYKQLGTKKQMKKGLRYLFFSRMMILKVFWDKDLDDFNVKVGDPRNIRVSPKATKDTESEYHIEEIHTTIQDLIATFPDKEESILKNEGLDKKSAMIDNKSIVYKEAWLDYGKTVIYVYKNTILKEEQNPYWDWDGIYTTGDELEKSNKIEPKERRTEMRGVKDLQSERKKEVAMSKEKSQEKITYENYLYNYFDSPRAPYIWGTVLEVEDRPIGETSLIEIVAPLQEAIDERKQQISDNARLMNGLWKIDTSLVKNMTRADARKMKAEASGIIYGHGVRNGVIREVGSPLPQFIFEDMVHSTADLDNIFGTQPTFRGEGGRQETATGRAILREQSFSRLDELIDLIDYMHLELYRWWFQLMKLNYTERHYTKIIGLNKAEETIELTQDDLQEGIEIKIIPGQILPEDRLTETERAQELGMAGAIDPITMFTKMGEDNPEDMAKKLIMYKANPFSIIDMSNEDLQKLQNVIGETKQQGEGQSAEKVAALRMQMEKITQSPEFRALPPSEQRDALTQMREQMAGLQK